MYKILLIDDDDIICSGLKIYLEHFGYEVVTANNGKTAYQIFNLEKYDLVITDIFMPNMDGLLLIQKLKKLNEHVKIIAISGGGNLINYKLMLKHAKFFGALKILNKPIDPEILVKNIEEILAA